MHCLLYGDIDLAALVHGHKEDVLFAAPALTLQLRAEPVPVKAELLQVRVYHAPVVYDDARIAAVGRAYPKLPGCRGALGREEDDVQCAVGFEYAVLDGAYIRAAFAAQLLHQLFGCEAAFAHLRLIDLSAHDEKARLAEEKAAQADAFEAQTRDEHLAAEEREDRHKAVYHRYAEVLERMRGEIGDERGDDELR